MKISTLRLQIAKFLLTVRLYKILPTAVIVYLLLIGGVGKSWGQGTIFTENMGTPSGNTSIAANTFQNSGTLTYSGTGDVRISTASTGYGGASGSGNVFITNTIGINFQIASISTVGYTNLVISFGAFKSTTASNLTELILEYSTDGVAYNPISFPAQPTGSGTAVWRLISNVSVPAGANGASNLRLRWRQTSTVPQFRIDDVTLTGDGGNYYWNGSNSSALSGNWDNSSTRWSTPTATTTLNAIWPPTGSSDVANFNGSGGGTVTLPGTIATVPTNTNIGSSTYTFASSSSDAALASPINLNANTLTFAPSTGNIALSGAISGTGALVLTSASSGNLNLSGTNTFSGGITASTTGSGSSRVRFDVVAACPTSGTLRVNTGSSIRFNVAGTYGGVTQALEFNPNQTATPSLDLGSGIATAWQGTVNFLADTRIEPSSGGTITFSGNATGAANLIKAASGTLIFSGTGNTLTGGTTIGNGTLTVNSSSSMGTGALTMFQTSTNNTAINLNNAAQSISSLSSSFTAVTGTQTQVITLGSGHTLTINQSSNTTYGTGAVSTLTSTLAGAGSIVKTGAGTLTLTSANTYTGNTTITTGTLVTGIDNALSSSTNVILNGGILTTGAAAGFNQTVGTLDLNATSTIALGTGSHTLTFANSSAVPWAGTTLTITGWTGTMGTSGTAGKFFVGADATGLSRAQLAKINFAGYSNGATILGTGEVVPVVPITYYPRTVVTDLSLLSDWTDDPTGAAGTSPVDFTFPSQTFNINDNAPNLFVLNSWTVSGGSNVTLTATTPLEFGPLARLTIGTGSDVDFNNNSVVLRSTSTGTATIGTITGTLTDATNVTVERWIPQRNASASGGRAYRLLTPTVSGSTINASWQEGLMNTVVGTNIIPGSPYALYGVQITGSGGNTNGFDVTQNNQASLYTTTNGAGPDLPYTAAPNTSDLLDAKKGYFLYIRGDRSSSMQLPYNPAGGMPTTSTTLRAKGTVQQGTVNFPISSTAGHFSMITNPYASVIDWQAVSTANPNIATSYTMWDPNVSTEGGFVVVTYGGSPTPGTSSAGRYIQPGEAFLVQTISGSSINITEAMKVTGNNNNGIFRITPFESFGAELYFTEANNNIRHSADGILVKYDNSYSANIDSDDFNELNNWNENIAINRSGKQLAVEARPVIVAKDTIPLIIGGLRQTNYEWVFTPSMFTNIGLKAELIDNFLNTRTLLSVIDSVVVPFNVTANPASSAANRFMVVFGTFGPLAIDVISIKAQAKNNSVQVDWTAKTEQDMDRYELERSFDGTSFSNIKTTAAVGNSQVAVNYSWLDVNPQVGNNYYRIKAIDKAGLVKYTSIVKVGFGKTNPAITVSPNPVTGNIVNLKLSDLPKGSYTVQLFNSMGQQVLVSRFNHSGGSVNQPVNLTSGIASGTYRLVLSDGETRLRTTIIKN